MIKKIFNEAKTFLKNSYKDLIILTILLIAFSYEFPCYIDATGGAINVSERIEVENKYNSEGSFNMAYVNEYPGNIIFILLAKINPNWDIVKYEDALLENETKEDDFNRSKILLNESVNNAIINAYELANKNVTIDSEKLMVTFVMPDAKTTIKTGDQIISIDGETNLNFSKIRAIVTSHNVDDKLEIIVKRNDKEKKVYAIVYEEENEKYIGIGSSSVTEVTPDPEIDLNFKESETGPSGGLMTALAIYDSLTKKDLTQGLKIVGTGTMERDGSVGSIGGVKYKLAGAVKKKADLFLVPDGENYKEAIKIAKEKNYKIKIVPIKNLKEAIEYLENL